MAQDSTVHVVLRLKGGGRKPFVSKYSSQLFNEMQEDPVFRVDLVQRCADGMQDDDNNAVNRCASQCITAKRNRKQKKRPMKQAGQPAGKSRSLRVKMQAGSGHAKEQWTRPCGAKGVLINLVCVTLDPAVTLHVSA